MRHRRRHGRKRYRPGAAGPASRERILLVGNPNVGKSVVFSYLTGRYSIASNYPGTTVEISIGAMGSRGGREVIDTPGVNSLFPKSEDEKVTRDIILANRQATVVQIADAKNIFRALLLTSQLAEIGCRVILVLNMMDEARQRGFDIDARELSRLLGIEVIETVAAEGGGEACLRY
jgi:ferrous iron transport protein B